MSVLADLPRDVQAAMVLAEANRRQKTNRIDWYYPDVGPLRRDLYKKHLAFFDAGRNHTERMMMAANRVGKTEGVGGYEMACHLMGEYPKWWTGRRWNRPVKAWCAGDTSLTVRDILQLKMMGPWGQFGTGLLREPSIIRHTPKRNVAEALDTVYVRHKPSGGISQLAFKSYDQGRLAFQGTEQDIVWPDEEPPPDIYSEMLTRVMTTGGMIMSTFTPLRGIGDVILGFMQKPLPDHRFIIQATWEDVPHLTKKMKEELASSYMPSERDARMRGIPTIGSGRIWPVALDDILVPDFVVPKHWRKAYALDVGWKKTAGLWGAWDAEQDIVYCYSEYYEGQREPAIHASAFKARGLWIPGVIDPASNGRSQVDGEQLMDLYVREGLDLTNADNSLDAGLYDVWQRLSTGRIKVFKTACQQFQMEFPLYHRDDKGKVVAKMNHLMDCLRYLIRSGLAVAAWEPSTTRRAKGKKKSWRTV